MSVPVSALAVPDDPLVQVYDLSVWLPPRMAPSMLRGFLMELGGELLESSPDRLRALLPGPGRPDTGIRSWLAALQARLRGWRKPGLVEMTLLIAGEETRPSNVRITVVLHPLKKTLTVEQLQNWQSQGRALFTDLHTYLLGRPPQEPVVPRAR